MNAERLKTYEERMDENAKTLLSKECEKLLRTMIFDESEKMRRRCARSVMRHACPYRIHDNKRTVYCATDGYLDRVYEDVVYWLSYFKVCDKRHFNLKTIIKRSLISEFMLSFGK